MNRSIKSRFKHYLVHPELLEEESILLRQYFQRLPTEMEEWQPKHVAFFFLIYFCRRAKKALWFQNNRQDSIPPNSILESADFDLAWSWLCRVQIHKIPECFHDALRSWEVEKWPLEITNHLLTPIEVLKWQAEGRRMIGIDLDAAINGKIVDGRRDAFEFAMHDLLHAYHFFKNRENYYQQVYFFKLLLKKIESPPIQRRMTIDKAFCAQMNYIMSDMNSHPYHLEQTLSAVLSMQEDIYEPISVEKFQLSGFEKF